MNSPKAQTSSKSNVALICGESGPCVWWDLETGTVLSALDLKGQVFSMNGAFGTARGRDAVVHIWNLKLRKSTLTYRPISDADVTDVTLSADGKQGLVAFETGVVMQVNFGTQKVEGRLEKGRGHVRHLSISEDGTLGFSRTSIGVYFWWDLQTGEPIRSSGGTASATSQDGKIAVLKANRGIILSRGKDFWHLVTDFRVKEPLLAVSNEGRDVLASSEDDPPRIIHFRVDLTLMALGEPATEIRRFDKDPTKLAISPDGTRALVAHQYGSINVWDLETGSLIRAFNGGNGKSPRILKFFSRDDVPEKADENKPPMSMEERGERLFKRPYSELNMLEKFFVWQHHDVIVENKGKLHDSMVGNKILVIIENECARDGISSPERSHLMQSMLDSVRWALKC